MESAERNGSALRPLLRSADRFSEAAIALGSLLVNTPLSSVSASLCSVTACDQRRPPPRFDAVAFLAMVAASGWNPPRAGLNAPSNRRFLHHQARSGEACT